MALNKIKIDKNIQLITYKLSCDLLALLLFSFFVLILVNGVLPQFFLQSSLFVKLILAIALNISLIAYLGNKFEIVFPLKKTAKNPLVPLFLIFMFMVSGNTLLKLRLWENILMTILLTLAAYQYYNLQTETKK